MSNIKQLLERRKQIKKKKPNFRRKDAFKNHKHQALGQKWRRSRGVDAKQRLKKRACMKSPSPGFGTPVLIKGFHKSGLAPVLVSSFSQLDDITKEQGIILSGKIGDRKRAFLLAEIKKKGLNLLNLDADDTVAKIQAKLKNRQDAKKKEIEKETEKKKSIDDSIKKQEAAQKEKEKEKKAEPEKELSDDEKKKIEKEEKDKVLLTKKL